jgi:hypothetical protein
MSVVELRRYALHLGARETLIALFEREFVTGQQAVGITLGGRFRDLDDPDRFVWLRSFPDMAARRRSLEAFYGGPLWRRHRDAANAMMVDSDDVLLLQGPGFDPMPDHPGPLSLTVCHPAEPADFAAWFDQEVCPALTASGRPPLGVHRTLHAENDYPALPVRTGEDVLLWFTADEHGADVPPRIPASRLLRPPARFRLAPVG